MAAALVRPPGEAQPLTFLFTDIAGSSRLWERFPEAMPGTLAHHDEIVSGAISTSGGKIFKAMGDQFCAVFEHPDHAVTAAIAAQQGLAQERWPDHGLDEPLLVRVAIHRGPATVRDNDYFGPTLSAISRLMQITHGGQVLITGTATADLQQALPEEFDLLDLGTRRLRDIATVEQVYQITGPGLQASFAQLESLDARPSNLPAPPTRMVGRVQAAAELRSLLLDPAVRLTTITGMGGLGKTRMAIHVAEGVLDLYEDGVWFIDLAAISHPDQVATAIGAALQLREQSGHAVKETLLSWLRQRKALLILDNCEHLLPGLESFVASLLSNCRQLEILATSREVLHVRGERRFPLDPMAIPGDSAQESDADSLALLVERLREHDLKFALTSQNDTVIAKICQRLEGLPLAIELAAPHVIAYGPQRMLDRLDQRLHYLKDGPRDLPDRQQSLQEVIQSSVDLLDHDEQRLFMRLSVFHGGWTAEAAAAVNDNDLDRTLTLLDSLTHKSLLIAGPERWRMLELVREFAAGLLDDSGELGLAAAAHAHWFAQLAAEAVKTFHGPEAATWLQRLDEDLANLQSALRWLIDSGVNNEPALAMATNLWPFFDQHGYPRQGRHWMEQALALPTTGNANVRANALRYLGNSYQFKPETAIRYYEESRQLALAAELPFEANRALFGIGQVTMSAGDYQGAMEIFDKFVVFSELNEDLTAAAAGQEWRALAAINAGWLDTAEMAAELALSHADAAGDLERRPWIILHQASIARLRGNRQLALDLATVAIGEAEHLGYRDLLAFLHQERAMSLVSIDPASARVSLGKALDEIKDLDGEREIAICLDSCVILLVSEGNHAEALAIANAVTSWRDATATPMAISEKPLYDSMLAIARLSAGQVDPSRSPFSARTLTLQEACALVLEAGTSAIGADPGLPAL